MRRAAFGVQMHSGWGVLVAIAGDPKAPEVAARSRIVTADRQAPGTIQPYHYAAQLQPEQRQEHILRCEQSSTSEATTAIMGVLAELEQRHYRILGAAVLFGAGRPLPELEKILAAHPLIHTAEGQFFRQTASHAFAGLNIPVKAIRERELEQQAKAVFGNAATQVQANIADLAKRIGPPWTKDHKTAALAAALLLCS